MKNTMLNEPLVSIGVPVFNSESKIKKVLKSILNQNYKNLEIIISDNASIDRTFDILTEFKLKDLRIKLYRQTTHLNPAENFKFTLLKAKGEYFMWNADDDFRSPDFVKKNVGFLNENPDYVASCSKNHFINDTNYEKFSIIGTFEERLTNFFKICWRSHGIFYSLIRTNILKDCTDLGQIYFGSDWAVNLFLLKHGNFNRLNSGSLIIGNNGISNNKNFFKKIRTSSLDWLFPFRRLIFFTLKLISDSNLFFKFKICFQLLKLNFVFAKHQLKSEILNLLIKLKTKFF